MGNVNLFTLGKGKNIKETRMKRKLLNISLVTFGILVWLANAWSQTSTIDSTKWTWTAHGRSEEMQLKLDSISGTDQYILWIKAMGSPSQPSDVDWRDLLSLRADAPGSIMFSTYDDKAYLESVVLEYWKNGGTKWDTYTPPTAFDKHWEEVKKKSAEALIGLIPVVGTLYTAADLLYLGFVDTTPVFLMSVDLPNMPNVAGKDLQSEIDHHIAPSKPEFTQDRFYDIYTMRWDKLDSSDFLGPPGIKLTFRVGREPGITEPLPLYIRVVVPFLILDTYDEDDEEYTRKLKYFVEMEWEVELPGLTPQPPPKPSPDEVETPIAIQYDAGKVGDPVPEPTSSDGGNWKAHHQSIAPPSIAVAVPNDAGVAAWKTTDRSEQRRGGPAYSIPVTNTQIAEANANGWRLHGRLRMVNDFNDTMSQCVCYDNGTRRWVLFFDLDSKGDLVVTQQHSSGDITHPLTTGGTGNDTYHDFELVYDPTSKTADFFFDEKLIKKGDTGRSSPSFTNKEVIFGSGSTPGQGEANWNFVQWKILSETEKQ